jgi:ribosomal protein S18 acetylase RimI-like enzyme
LLLPDRYQLRVGSGKDGALLVRFMILTYQELFPEQTDFSHLGKTVEHYFSSHTPLWWVEFAVKEYQSTQSIACLWLGNAIDQVQGDRYAHIFLLYVTPEHRHQGIGKSLMGQAQTWSKSRGDRQIGLQVFPHNQPALNLYHRLGYQPHSLSMIKPHLDR